MNNTNYVIIFVLTLTVVVAVGLTGLQQSTKSIAELNEKIFNKRSILQTVEAYLPDGKTVKDLNDSEVLDIFDKQVEQVVVDAQGNPLESILAEEVDMAKEKKKPEMERMYPLYIFNSGAEKAYIVSVRGSGLWDEIWGNIAIKNDFNTIVGVTFDHRQETPGLGAEIKDNPAFPKQFEGKKIYDNQGKYVSVTVRKGGAKDMNHEVDGISGATVTSDGVSEMLDRGIKIYEPYFKSMGASGSVLN